MTSSVHKTCGRSSYSVLVSHANSLAVKSYKEGEKKVNNLSTKLQLYEDTISIPIQACISFVKWLSKDLGQFNREIKEDQQFKKDYQKFKEEMSHALPVQVRVSAIREQVLPSLRERVHTTR